jgi:HPt (histidine-containing phosphotransfer) domain-containing protein
VPDPIDPQRIAELEGLIGPDIGPILESLEQSISSAIDDADGALAAGELSRVAYAAHRCRNDALMVGAVELQKALAALEAASRRLELEGARDALTRVREVWPGIRDELARAARGV